MFQINPEGSNAGFQTSTSLLELVKKRDNTAWQKLTETYGPLVYHWCRQSGLGADESADLLQDVYRALVIHIDGFEKSTERGSFRAWLWTITRNRIIDKLRVKNSRAHAIGGSEAYWRLQNVPDHEPDDLSDSGVSASASLTNRALRLIKSEVKETTWLAFWRSTIDEIDPAAVADELQISVESVWQSKSRVLRRLRQLLT